MIKILKKKSVTKLKSLIRDNGKSLILVSHEKELVKEICHKAIILDQGNSYSFDNINEAFIEYEKQ